MMKLLSSVLFTAAFLYQPNDRFQSYLPVTSYEIKNGIQILPTYAANGNICEISIEKRHSHDERVDLNPTLSKGEILSLFDQLAPRAERGDPSWKLPDGSEFTEVDGGTRATHIMYQNLSLVMYGAEPNPNYAVAIISWKKTECEPVVHPK
jgi:hypothetical protein